jgi:hypothetical protein
MNKQFVSRLLQQGLGRSRMYEMTSEFWIADQQA